MLCIYFEFVPIPTSVQILMLYAQFLSRSFKSVDSIRNYNSAIKLLHLYLEYPQFESFHFKSILKGLSKLNLHCPNQAQPITPYMLCDIFKHFDMSSLIDATVWCLCLHAFYLMFRKSNLVPDTVATFDSEKQLCRKNFTFNERRNVLMITIQWSKTIQFGERTLVIPLVSIPDSPLCPFQAYFTVGQPA
jgi:hypothetical protein